MKLGVNHGYSCCIKKIIKNKLFATRSEFGNYGKVVVMRRLNSQSGWTRNKLNNKVVATTTS